MMEERYVYVIHYFSMRLDTGEIKDKIWLEGNSYYAKQFFNIRKDMIDTAVVLPEGVEILKKYDYKLPSISNQKGNAYLKEIQTICGINKTLHFHLFRKTYGTRLLNRGVRLETVSKCLGHSSTQITQMAYAKLLKQTIIDEVKEAFTQR